MADRRNNSIVHYLLLLILFGALGVRLFNLGECSYWTDEFNHVIAAQSLLKNGSPQFPGGVEYTRGLPYTHLVSLSFYLFGINEEAARYPSVILNLIFLIIGFVCVRSLFNETVALAFVLIMAFAPYPLFLARSSRMYSGFQLFYFLGTILFFLGFECRRFMRISLWPAIEAQFGVNIAFLVGATICLYISYVLHPLTVTFGAAFVAYIGAMFLYSVWKDSFYNALITKYGLVLILFGTALVVYLLIRPEAISESWTKMRAAPEWASAESSLIRVYQYKLLADYPAFFFLFPLGILYLIFHNVRLGIYVAVNFGFLLIIYSLVFTFRQERFMNHLLPYFFLSVLPMLEEGLRILYSRFTGYIHANKGRGQIVGWGAMIFAIFSLAYPWFPNAFKGVSQCFWVEDWKSLSYQLKANYENPSVITLPESEKALFAYAGIIPDYFIYPRGVNRLDGVHFPNISPIHSLKEFSTVVKETPNMIIVARRDQFFSSRFSRDGIDEFLSKEFENPDFKFNNIFVVLQKKNGKFSENRQ